MSNLQKQAEDLGIDVDGRWSDETLQQKINEAKAGRKTGAQAVNTSTNRANESIPATGGVRVRTSEELREEQTENIPAAPYPADPKQSHAVASGRAEREETALAEFKTSDLTKINDETEKTVPARLLYDWWDAQGVRHVRGTVLDLPINEAKLLIGQRKAERADPLPGDN